MDKERRNVNLGILIFKSYSNRGYGSRILEIISNFCFEILPGYVQEIGTRVQHYAMRKIALKVGFQFSREDTQSLTIYFVRLLGLQLNLNFLKVEPLLVVANDAGGAYHLATMLRAFDIFPPLRLSGPAVDIFRRLGVTSTAPSHPSQNGSHRYILLGTSLFGGPESQALSEDALKGIEKIALLDHWVNYRERFHPSGQILPDVLLVTNHFAYLKAKEQFTDINVVEIPDFQLASMKLQFMSKVRNPRYALILLEPESETTFCERFPQVSFGKLIRDVEMIADERGVTGILLRTHPAHSPIYIEKLKASLATSAQINVSTNTNLIDDLIGADFVVGFNTYALYLASELRIQTFGYFSHNPDHWSCHFPKISAIRSLGRGE